MPVTVVRLNLVDPAATPRTLSERYRAAVEMAAFAERNEFCPASRTEAGQFSCTRSGRRGV